jgi:serine/threonine protein kinase
LAGYPDDFGSILDGGSAGTSMVLSRQHDWVVARFDDAPALAVQGWKLHVSAHPASAADVLEAVLPILIAHRVRFKVAASHRALMILNAGAAGPSQVGKFITVYPESDDQARVVAADLDRATRGMPGPRVPSDRALRPGSLVHYRYGSFTGATVMQLPDGAVVSALTSPTGEVVPDRRQGFYAPPDWAICPFPPHHRSWESLPGGGESEDAAGYRTLGMLSDTGRGSVVLGVDLRRRRRCVFKTAAREPDPLTWSAGAALQQEAILLRSLPANSAWPEVFDFFETADHVVLVMQDIDGVSLAEHVSSCEMRGRPMDVEDVVGLGLRIIDAVAAVHGQGVVHRDLKSSNVLVRPDGQVSLVDFEHAARVGQPARSGGTRGYMSAQQRAGHPATIQNDVYALGALLMLLATGCEPSQAPDDEDLLSRPLELLRPGLPSPLVHTIAQCLDGSPGSTPSLSELAKALRGVHRPPPMVGRGETVADPGKPDLPIPPGSKGQLLSAARQVCDSLCERAVREPDKLVTWISTAPETLPVPHRQINNGVPGILMALALGWATFGIERHRDLAVRGARWLAQSQELPGARISGLYAGEAGVGAALLLAGLLAEDSDMITAAYECERRLRSYPFHALDLYHGTAGRLRFLVMLWLLDQDSDVLAEAQRCAEHLHETSITTPDGRSAWSAPDFSGGVTVASYAHGVSGIADALLDLYEISAETQHLSLAASAAQWVTDHSVPSLSDGTGRDWGNGGAFSGLWCYGASGVGLLYLHLYRLGVDDTAADLAHLAAKSAALAGRHAQPGLCHGLSGSIEYLLDVYRHTHEPELLARTWELQRLLQSYQHRTPSGLGYPVTRLGTGDTSYMLGDAGVMGTLIRQASLGRHPRLLSTEAVRLYQSRPAAPEEPVANA